jgi:lysylphosphatidylglycerol synthetase-like protein (DUF2156 family)
MTSTSDDRHQIVQIIRRWGGLTTDALLDPVTQFFIVPGVEGLIGYRLRAQCAVVYGDPVCAPQDIPVLAHAFHQFCEGENLRVVYLIASESFAKWAINHICQASVQFGSELFIDPQCDPRSLHGTHASLVRRKVRHATHEGAVVKEYLVHDVFIEQNMLQLARTWLQHKRRPHISNVHIFEDTDGKRWFYAMQNGMMIGLLVLNFLESRQGWLINHLMISPEAPGGTPELLVISALDALRQEGCAYATFGVVPNPALDEIAGLQRLLTWTVRLVYQAVYHLYHLKGHMMFWGKFQPQTNPSYLLFSQPRIGYQEIKALMHALNISVR